MFTTKLTSGQVLVIQTKLPVGYTLQVDALSKRTQRPSNPYAPNSGVTFDSESSHLQAKPKRQATKSIINKDVPLSIEDELYAKSPHVLSVEIRRCYVVFHKLKRHFLFPIFEEHFNKALKTSDSYLDRWVLEGPAGQTSYHFWLKTTQMFKWAYQHLPEIKLQIMTLENYFNEIFKYVHNQQKRISVSSSKRKHSGKQLSQEELVALRDDLCRVGDLGEIWQVLCEELDTALSDEVEFELDKLPISALRRLEKYVGEKLLQLKRTKSTSSSEQESESS